jgi:hypothetical protein
VPHGGVGHRLADLCARLATWLHVAGKEGDRQGASLDQIARRAAPAPSLRRSALGGRNPQSHNNSPKIRSKSRQLVTFTCCQFDIACFL